MQFGEKEIRFLNNPEGVKQYFYVQPLRGFQTFSLLSFSELHSELFKFNAFSVFRLMGNGQRFKLASSCYMLTINYLAIENQKRTPQYFIVFFVQLLKN